jgi:hypothetical protein
MEQDAVEKVSDIGEYVDTLHIGYGKAIARSDADTVGESFELNVAAAQEAGTLIGTAKPIILAQGSVRGKWNRGYSYTA